MDFSEQQEALVKEAWEVMQQNIPQHSLCFFTLILQIAPSAKDLFSFLKDSDEVPQNNPQLRAHAATVFKMIYEAAVQLQEKGEVVVADTTLDAIGSIHHEKGVSKTHFPIMRAALLRTVKEAVGDEKWTDDMQEAWAVAFDELARAIKAAMQAKAEAEAEAVAKVAA